MILLDANVLLFAANAGAPEHEPALAWLRRLFRGTELVGLPWVSLWAFLRISTNPRLFSQPLTAKEAFTAIRHWISQPGVVLLAPGPRHWEILEKVVEASQAAGPLLSDAALAAMAMECGATLASTDRDFVRFEGLRWINPLASP